MPSKKVVIRLSHELNIYIDSGLADKRFANLYTISKLVRLKVYTKKYICFLFGLSASQARASSSYHHCVGR